MARSPSRWFVLVPVGLISATSWWGCLSSSDDTPVTPGLDAGTFDASVCGATGCPDVATSGPDAAVDARADADARAGADADAGANADADAGADADAEAGADAGADANADAGPDAGGLTDVFVDATAGLDTNPGASGAPVKTLYKAIALVAAGGTIWAADGAYNQANQGSAGVVAIPDSVTLRATHPGLAVVEGINVTANGASATIDGIVFDKASTLVASNSTAASPTVTLTGLQFKAATSNSTLSVGGSTKVTMTAPTFSGTLHFGVVTVAGSAELTVIGGSFDAGGAGAPGFGASLITMNGTSKLTLDGVTMKSSLTPGIGVAGNSTTTPVSVTLKNHTVLDAVGTTGNCASSAAIILAANATLVLDSSQIKNAPAAGICVRNGASTHISVTLQNGASLLNDGAGLAAEPGTGSEATVVINGASLASNTSAGITWAGGGSFDIQSATVTGNGTGMNFNPGVPLSVKVRNTTMIGSTTYGLLLGTNTASVATLDLGTVGSPGGNTLSTNTTTGLRVALPAGEAVTAVGNTWNAGIQSADGAGHYTAGTVVTGPQSGTNYILDNATPLTL